MKYKSESFFDIGRNAWLTGTETRHLWVYLYKHGVKLHESEINEIERGFFDCQKRLYTINSVPDLLRDFLTIRKIVK